MSLKENLTLVTAAIGAILGIINTVTPFIRNRTRLNVSAKRADVEGQNSGELGCIEITNLSSFAVTVREVGFTDGSNPRKHARYVIGDPIVFDDKKFPRRLEPRQTVSGYFKLKPLPSRMTRAYAITDCGKVSYAKGEILKDITYVRYRRA